MTSRAVPSPWAGAVSACLLAAPAAGQSVEEGSAAGGQDALFTRELLLGPMGGHRGRLAEHGIELFGEFTQTLQSVVSGGLDDGLEYQGSLDYGAQLDTTTAGWWQGGLVRVMGRTRYGDDVNGSSGGLIPANTDALFPAPDGFESGVMEFSVTQFLSEELALQVGKIDTLDGDQNEFAHGRGRRQFQNMAMTANPVAATTVPESALGAVLAWFPAGLEASVAVIDSEGSATRSGFDTLFDAGTTFIAEARLRTNLFDKAGHHLVGATYGDGEYDLLNPRDQIVDPDGVPIPGQIKDGSWSLYYNFDQYVWTPEEGRGIGVFGRLGVADERTNPFEFFASAGVGGKGGLAGRERDSFGLGIYFAETSSELPQVLGIDDELGVELYYDIEVAPWLHFTPDLQFVDGALTGDDAWLLGVRAHARF